MTGCTGRGKSTFCNFLSKSNKFKPEALPDSTIGWGDFGEWGAVAADLTGTQCNVVKDLLGGVTLRIIDLPGYLATQNRTGNDREDLAKDGKLVLDEFAKAMMHAKDGIDAIFIALRAAERYTKEEELLMQFISLLQLWDHCILLFTHGDKAGKDEDHRYKKFHEMIKSPAFPDRCPVLHKMLQSVNNRFVIVESVNSKGDQGYYHSKVEELCGAIEVVRDKTGPAIGHPLLSLARSAFEVNQVQQSMQDVLDKEKDEKGKIQEQLKQAEIERKEWEKAYKSLQAQLQSEKEEKKGKILEQLKQAETEQEEREKAYKSLQAQLQSEKEEKTRVTPQVVQEVENLQDALPKQLNPKGDDKQDTAARAACNVLKKWVKEAPTGADQDAPGSYAHLAVLADDRGKMMDELNVLIEELYSGIGLAFKKRIARKINEILRNHNVETSGDHSITVAESNERDGVIQAEDASRQQTQEHSCRLL